jgi:hypothetical protein
MSVCLQMPEVLGAPPKRRLSEGKTSPYFDLGLGKGLV